MEKESTKQESAEIHRTVFRAAYLIAHADSLIISAGAGIGVDSGLPDFRGTEGFWKAYPALAKARIRFEQVACPDTFETNPKLAWGFYGHRLNLYRNTEPHNGFSYLLDIAKHLEGGAFVFTSNVDSQFQKSGFSHDQIVECHGSIHHMQCLQACNKKIWEADQFMPEIDEENCLLTSTFPTCPDCGGIARPNILMFGDYYWLDWRTQMQLKLLNDWRETVHNSVVIEIGAGNAIPTVRRFGQSLDIPLIRINPTDAAVKGRNDVALNMRALEGIAAIKNQLNEMGFDQTCA